MELGRSFAGVSLRNEILYFFPFFFIFCFRLAVIVVYEINARIPVCDYYDRFYSVLRSLVISIFSVLGFDFIHRKHQRDPLIKNSIDPCRIEEILSFYYTRKYSNTCRHNL